MSSELVERKQNQLATTNPQSSLAAQELGTEDFIIPRILLMQGTSEMLENFALGDIIHTGEEKKLGGKDEPFEVIPFYVNKTYEIFKKEGGDWVGRKPWGNGYPELEWEGTYTTDDGTTFEVKNVKNYNIYVLLADEEGAFPCVISFRSSAGKEAKKITSHFVMMTRLGKAPYNVVWSISSERVQAETADGKKAYQKYVIKKARNSTEEEIDNAANWLQIVAQQGSNITYNTEEVEAKDPTPKEAATTTVNTKNVKNYAPNATVKTAAKPSSKAVEGEMPF